MIRLSQANFDEIVAHAREQAPNECCGLISGTNSVRAHTIYPLRNVAADPLSTYEAAPEDLFAAQRSMRDRGEQLLAIYHSHPRANDPTPSETDVRLVIHGGVTLLWIATETMLRPFHLGACRKVGNRRVEVRADVA